MLTNIFGQKKGLNGNIIKIIALITMTIDHVGFMFFPKIQVLRIIGRIAYPLFAYMIAEGCYYTRNKLRHFLMVFGLAVICQVVFFIFDGSLYMSILITFSFSIVIIFAYDYAIKSKKWWAFLILIVILFFDYFCNYKLAKLFNLPDFQIDYGFFGTLLPLFTYLFKNSLLKWLLTALGLLALCLELGDIEWWSFLALIPLAFYNGQRGKYKLKYLFYIYYPLHLVALEGLLLIL